MPEMAEKPKTVDAYIAAAPKELHARLRALRTAIRSAAPDAEEKLSYGMPYYGYEGRLAYFAYAKEHIGLYVPPPVVADHAKDLRTYQTAMATVRFPHDKALPIALVKKLIRARKKLNEEKHMKKAKKAK